MDNLRKAFDELLALPCFVAGNLDVITMHEQKRKRMQQNVYREIDKLTLSDEQKMVKEVHDAVFENELDESEYSFIVSCYHWVFVVKRKLSDKQSTHLKRLAKNLK